MRTPEEIKKGLECCARLKFPNAYCDGCNYLVRPAEHLWECKNQEILTDALTLIEQLEAQVPRWISVEERLPEVSDVVLVVANGKPLENITLDNALLIASFWDEEGWIADGFEGWDALKVTHWMPLPEPLKEG